MERSLWREQGDGFFHGRRTRLRGKLFRHQGHYHDPFGGGHRGLNPLLKSVLARAAAVCAMADSGGALSFAVAKRGTQGSPSPNSSFLKFVPGPPRGAFKAGCEVICFHAQGLGDRAMEELIEQGFIEAVLDLVPAGIAEELLGGNRAAGPQRLEAAGRMASQV